MKPLSTIPVFEYDALYTYEREDGRYLTRTQFEKLCSFNDSHKNKYFTILRNGVKFRNYVGVIQVGNTTLEILPKADKSSGGHKVWQKALLSMLKVCNKIKKESYSEAALKSRKNNLLESYFDIYCSEVESILQQGISKKYKRIQGQTKAFKGKLLFKQNLQKNCVHQERFYTEHSIFTSNNLFNQVLKLGLVIISNIASNSQIRDRAKGLLIHFVKITDNKSINEQSFTQLSIGRSIEKYKEALKIAKLIILNYSPDIKSGKENFIAILFDMNKLWEEYVYRMLLQFVNQNYLSFKVLAKDKKKFWGRNRLEPDIVLKKEDKESSGETYIIDAKWKLPKKTATVADLRQVYAYNRYWDAERALLLYPGTSADVDFKPFLNENDPIEHSCKMGFVHILNEDMQLNPDLGRDVLGLLNITIHQETELETPQS